MVRRTIRWRDKGRSPLGARCSGYEIRHRLLYRRGADRLRDGPAGGSISFLITGDEEAEAVNGTVKVLEWMEANGRPGLLHRGEPTTLPNWAT